MRAFRFVRVFMRLMIRTITRRITRLSPHGRHCRGFFSVPPRYVRSGERTRLPIYLPLRAKADLFQPKSDVNELNPRQAREGPLPCTRVHTSRDRLPRCMIYLRPIYKYLCIRARKSMSITYCFIRKCREGAWIYTWPTLERLRAKPRNVHNL